MPKRLANIQVQYLLLVHNSWIMEMQIFKRGCEKKWAHCLFRVLKIKMDAFGCWFLVLVLFFFWILLARLGKDLAWVIIYSEEQMHQFWQVLVCLKMWWQLWPASESTQRGHVFKGGLNDISICTWSSSNFCIHCSTITICAVSNGICTYRSVFMGEFVTWDLSVINQA